MAKFTLEQMIEALNPKFTNTDGKTSLKLSERTVKETLTPILSLAGDDTELAAFVNDVVFPIIDSANRNYIKDTTDFAKNYKPTVPPVVTPTVPPVTPPAPVTDPDVLKRLEAAELFMKTYKDDIDKQIAERKLKEMSSAVEAKLIEQGCTLEAYRENATYKLGVDVNKSVEDNVKAIKTLYDEKVTKGVEGGYIPAYAVTSTKQVMTEEEHIKQAQSDKDLFDKRPN